MKTRAARTHLLNTIESYKWIFGRAEFTMGYRCGLHKANPQNSEDDALRKRESDQYALAVERGAAVLRALAAYRRAVTAEHKQARRKR